MSNLIKFISKVLVPYQKRNSNGNRKDACKKYEERIENLRKIETLETELDSYFTSSHLNEILH